MGITAHSIRDLEIRKGDLLYGLRIIFREPRLVGTCCLAVVQDTISNEVSEAQIARSRAKVPSVVGLALRSPHTKQCMVMSFFRRVRPLAGARFVRRTDSNRLLVRISVKHFRRMCQLDMFDHLTDPMTVKAFSPNLNPRSASDSDRKCCEAFGQWCSSAF